MPTKYSDQYKRRNKSMKSKGQRPCFFYMDENTHARIKRSVPRGQMTAFIRAALELSLNKTVLNRLKQDMTKYSYKTQKAA